MFWLTAPDGPTEYLSRSWYDFTGQTPETALGTGSVSFVATLTRMRAFRVSDSRW